MPIITNNQQKGNPARNERERRCDMKTIRRLFERLGEIRCELEKIRYFLETGKTFDEMHSAKPKEYDV